MIIGHLDDDEVLNLFEIGKIALQDNGKMITIDPCFVQGQNIIAKYLISKDRGQNVRGINGYKSLAKAIFPKSKSHVKHRKWIPYTHFIMELKK